MAYTIISQNNTTTTLSDENGNVITVPARVTLATSTDYTIKKVNNNSVDLESGDGKIIRGVPACVVLAGEGGGGGSVDTSKVVNADVLPTADASSAGKYYLYTGATTAEYTQNYIYKNVKTATYTGEVDFAFGYESSVTCTASDFANFITSEGGVDPTLVVRGGMTYRGDNLWELVGYNSDGDELFTVREHTEDFQDAGFTFSGTPTVDDALTYDCTITEASATYSWTRVDVQPAPSGLPDQTGQSGKFLTTDGTDASWSDKPLVNGSMGDSSHKSLSILADVPTNNSQQYNTIIGVESSLYNNALSSSATAVGCRAEGHVLGVAIGYNAKNGAGYRSIAIGSESESTGAKSIAIGASACKATAERAIQLGAGQTNSDPNTFKVANANGNFEIMSADGTIPTARLTKVNTTATLAVADWSSNTQTITVSGVKADSVVFVSPAPASASDYASAGILCTGQSADSLTFTATTTPSVAIVVNVVCL